MNHDILGKIDKRLSEISESLALLARSAEFGMMCLIEREQVNSAKLATIARRQELIMKKLLVYESDEV